MGVVATQSFTNPSYGPLGLRMMKKGVAPRRIVEEMTGSDPGRDLRQLAVLDSRGRVSAYTGRRCVPEAGHIVGKSYSVQANMMLSDEVWPSMAKAFSKARGDIAIRMLAALEAAEKARGDIRGRQSAALLVVRGVATGRVWEDRLVDLRVDDSSDPVGEIRRILDVHRAYEHMNKGDLALEGGDVPSALRHYSTAERMNPDNEEMKFWHAAMLVNVGEFDRSLPLFSEVFSKNENWRKFLTRLVPLGLLNVDGARLRELMEL